MSFIWPLVIRGLTLLGVLVTVLFLLGISLGATGFSDKLLQAQVGEEVRGLRVTLAQTVRDPEELESILEVQKADIERFYGLDQPWYMRLPKSIGRVLVLDLGEARTLRSSSGSSRVSDIILERLPNTALLLTTSGLITAVFGILVGTKLATRIGSRLDRGFALFSAISFAVPAWWFGIMMILLFAFQFKLLPPGGMYSTPPPEEALFRLFDLIKHAILPVVTLVLVTIGPYLYTVRTLTMTVAVEDHVFVARAKGLEEGKVIRRHILRVAAPPIMTGLILGLTSSLGGSILVETVFNWQGMGRLYFDSVAGTPDEAIIVGLTFMFTALYILARFVLEILYLILDPRVRYGS